METTGHSANSSDEPNFNYYLQFEGFAYHPYDDSILNNLLEFQPNESTDDVSPLLSKTDDSHGRFDTVLHAGAYAIDETVSEVSGDRDLSMANPSFADHFSNMLFGEQPVVLANMLDTSGPAQTSEDFPGHGHFDAGMVMEVHGGFVDPNTEINNLFEDNSTSTEISTMPEVEPVSRATDQAQLPCVDEGAQTPYDVDSQHTKLLPPRNDNTIVDHTAYKVRAGTKRRALCSISDNCAKRICVDDSDLRDKSLPMSSEMFPRNIECRRATENSRPKAYHRTRRPQDPPVPLHVDTFDEPRESMNEIPFEAFTSTYLANSDENEAVHLLGEPILSLDALDYEHHQSTGPAADVKNHKEAGHIYAQTYNTFPNAEDAREVELEPVMGTVAPPAVIASKHRVPTSRKKRNKSETLAAPKASSLSPPTPKKRSAPSVASQRTTADASNIDSLLENNLVPPSTQRITLADCHGKLRDSDTATGTASTNPAWEDTIKEQIRDIGSNPNLRDDERKDPLLILLKDEDGFLKSRPDMFRLTESIRGRMEDVEDHYIARGKLIVGTGDDPYWDHEYKCGTRLHQDFIKVLLACPVLLQAVPLQVHHAILNDGFFPTDLEFAARLKSYEQPDWLTTIPEEHRRKIFYPCVELPSMYRELLVAALGKLSSETVVDYDSKSIWKPEQADDNEDSGCLAVGPNLRKQRSQQDIFSYIPAPKRLIVKVIYVEEE